VRVGVAPKAPETVTPTAVVVVLADAPDDPDAGLDEWLGLELELHAVSSTAGTTSKTAEWRGPISTNTSFGFAGANTEGSPRPEAGAHKR